MDNYRTMEEERRIFHTFMGVHAHKAPLRDERCAHLMFRSAASSTILDPLITLTRDEILQELDSSSELVRWLLNQVSTYDPSCQRVVGLVFDTKTVLSEVLRDPRPPVPAGDAPLLRQS